MKRIVCATNTAHARRLRPQLALQYRRIEVDVSVSKSSNISIEAGDVSVWKIAAVSWLYWL